METAQLGRDVNALKLVVKKVEGKRDELKCMVNIMTRERTVLSGRRDDLSSEGGGNRSKIMGLIFRLEKLETRCSRIMAEAEASRFELRSKEEVDVGLKRLLEAKAKRRGIIEAETRTGEDMAEEAL